jgi:hypothetical protein
MPDWRTQERTDSHPVPELASDPLHRAVLGAQLCTQGPDHPHRSDLLLRAIPTGSGLP